MVDRRLALKCDYSVSPEEVVDNYAKTMDWEARTILMVVTVQYIPFL